VVNARKTFCQLAVEKIGYPGAEVACYLGVTTSSFNRSAISEEAADLKKYLKMLLNLPHAASKLFK